MQYIHIERDAQQTPPTNQPDQHQTNKIMKNTKITITITITDSAQNWVPTQFSFELNKLRQELEQTELLAELEQAERTLRQICWECGGFQEWNSQTVSEADCRRFRLKRLAAQIRRDAAAKAAAHRCGSPRPFFWATQDTSWEFASQADSARFSALLRASAV